MPASSSSIKGLNLGCGNRILDGCINHDRHKHRPEIDQVWNLNKLPWPWEDKQFSYVSAWAVLEHLDIDLLKSMNEIHRILDGTLDVKLPYWAHSLTYADPTHRWGYSLDIFDIFDPETERGKKYGFYTPHKWRIVSRDFLDDRHSTIQAQMETR